MQWIQLPELRTEISAAPVDCNTYCAYLADSEQPLPPCPLSRKKPLVGVSATRAMAYAAWLTQHENRAYRLPTVDELMKLAQQTIGEQTSWCCEPDQPAVAIRHCHYEWIDCAPDPAGQQAQLHCATHPYWLLRPHRKSTHAALADTALPYVTFHLVREKMNGKATTGAAK